MCDEIHYYKSRVSELESINSFLKRNTLLSAQSRIEYVRDERSKTGLPVHGITLALEVIKSMLKER